MREIYVFVGEARSKTAKENGHSWQSCQTTGKPVLSAIRLWDALKHSRLDPNAQIFFNLWDDSGELNEFVPEILKEMVEDREIIVGLGQKVQNELDKLGIPHLDMIHPAARGKMASKVLYRKHAEKALAQPAILKNPFYKECIQLAMCSKSADQRYGSLLVKNGTILGRGYNRAVAHPSFGKLERVIYQGYSNHAEIEALNDAIAKGYDVKHAEIYVGGYFPKKNGLLFLKNEFTCLKCPPIIKSFAVTSINIPSPQGWLSKNPDEATDEARNYISGGIYKNRLSSVLGQWTVNDLI